MPPRRPPSPRTASRAGIVQIAARLGVSPSTVSRALRPETAHMVQAERRKEILDLAERQRFSPNPGARMLRKGVNATLTVIVPLDENIFFSEYYGRFLAGTLHAAAARDWDVHICTLRPKGGADFRETMQHLGLDTSGIIYLAEPLTREAVEQLRGYRRPLVLTKSSLPPDADVQDLGNPVVGVDNVGGARAAASLLLQLGHRRIGLLLGPSTSRDAVERKSGYLDVLEKGGVTVRASWIVENSFSAEGGRAGMAKILQQDQRPTAFCCASDEIAFGAIDAARGAGLECPRDISIIGFDDGLWATAARPTLTTVRQPLAELAERAVGLVIEAATTSGSSLLRVQSDMPAALVIRESTRAARGAE
jgi:DNA-binding LacI/PurR family transcriptional regulator